MIQGYQIPLDIAYNSEVVFVLSYSDETETFILTTLKLEAVNYARTHKSCQQLF